MRLAEGEVGVYVHLDDFGTMARTDELAAEASDLIAVRLLAAGFGVTRRVIGEGEKFIGLTIRSAPARLGAYPAALG